LIADVQRITLNIVPICLKDRFPKYSWIRKHGTNLPKVARAAGLGEKGALLADRHIITFVYRNPLSGEISRQFPQKCKLVTGDAES
jgi:hypothetical protein